jgi:hypothetical protein
MVAQRISQETDLGLWKVDENECNKLRLICTRLSLSMMLCRPEKQMFTYTTNKTAKPANTTEIGRSTIDIMFLVPLTFLTMRLECSGIYPRMCSFTVIMIRRSYEGHCPLRTDGGGSCTRLSAPNATGYMFQCMPVNRLTPADVEHLVLRAHLLIMAI